MITEQQAQNCMAYLELARTAIDNAELKIASAVDKEHVGVALSKASGELAAAARNLVNCAEEISKIASETIEKQYGAAASARVDA